MFSVISNIYKKKTKGPTLMELFTATGKLKKFVLTTRDVRCVRQGDTAHIDTIFKFLPHVNMLTRVWQEFEYRIDVCCVTLVHTSNISNCQNKLFQSSCGCEQFH